MFGPQLAAPGWLWFIIIIIHLLQQSKHIFYIIQLSLQGKYCEKEIQKRGIFFIIIIIIILFHQKYNFFVISWKKYWISVCIFEPQLLHFCSCDVRRKGLCLKSISKLLFVSYGDVKQTIWYLVIFSP